MNRGETVTRQTVRGGTRRLVETGHDLGEEALRIGRQAEVPVGLRVACLPAAVIMDQAPERDVIVALRQEQAAGARKASRTAKASEISQMWRSSLPSAMR